MNTQRFEMNGFNQTVEQTRVRKISQPVAPTQLPRRERAQVLHLEPIRA